MSISEEMIVNGNTSRTALKGRTVNDDLNGTFTVYSESKIPQILVGPDPDTGHSAIKLYDLQGVELIALAVDANGVPYLSFSNENAVEVVNITAGGTPHLAFKNTSGNTMLTIGLTGSNANPLIELSSANGTKQITLGTDATAGQSNLSVYDPNGERQAYVGIDPKLGTEPVIAATQAGIDVITELKK